MDNDNEPIRSKRPRLNVIEILNNGKTVSLAQEKREGRLDLNEAPELKCKEKVGMFEGVIKGEQPVRQRHESDDENAVDEINEIDESDEPKTDDHEVKFVDEQEFTVVTLKCYNGAKGYILSKKKYKGNMYFHNAQQVYVERGFAVFATKDKVQIRVVHGAMNFLSPFGCVFTFTPDITCIVCGTCDITGEVIQMLFD